MNASLLLLALAAPPTATSSVGSSLPVLDDGLLGPPSLRSAEPDAPADTVDLGASTVSGRGHRPPPPAARFEAPVEELSAIPVRDATEQLQMAPGVLTTNAGGDGHAQETFMRGFAAGTGQDLELKLDGVELNEPSNAHNHGYADLFFIIPELVHSLEVTQGSFDPRQGDFAIAGSAEYHLGVRERGSRVKMSYGSFDTVRLVSIIAPHDAHEGTFGGLELYRSSGYGTQRSADRASVMARYTEDDGTDALRWSASFYGYGSRWDQPGPVRQDDYLRERVDFFGSYDPNQGGESKRFLLALDGAVGPSDAELSATAWAQARSFRNRENFTGFVQDTQDPQRGDGAEQRYDTLSVGAQLRYALSRTMWGRPQAFELGLSARHDGGRSTQVRLRSGSAIPYLSDFDRELSITRLSAWARLGLNPFEILSVDGGVRIDAFSFGVRDLDGDTADLEDGIRLAEQSSAAFGFAVSPRITAALTPLDGLRLTTSYGHGIRSSDAGSLSDGENAPFSVARELEAGASYTLGETGGPNLELSAAYVFAAVERELVFDPAAGRNVDEGASTRHAVLASALARGFGLTALVNLGYSEATLDATGDLVPYIPQLVVGARVAGRYALWDWSIDRVPVEVELGLGYTGVPGRPLPLGEYGDAFHVVNASAAARLYYFELGLEARNLFDVRYRQTELFYESNFRGPSVPGSKTPQRHFIGGEPLYLGMSLTVFIEDWLAEG